MKTISKNFLFTFFILGLVWAISSCVKDNIDNNTQQEPESGILDLVIPEEFDFATSKTLEVTISDNKTKLAGEAKYEVYLYSSTGVPIEAFAAGDDGEPFFQSGTAVDILNNLNSTRITSDPNFTINLTIPNYYDSLFVVKNDLGHYSTLIQTISGQKMQLTFANKPYNHKSGSKDDPTDMLWAVNSLREVYTVNPLTGELTMITTMPSNSGGSWACAIDPVEEIFYTVGISYPYHLYAWDINDESWETKGPTYYQGPRLAYNINDGMLYYSFDQWVLLINPDNGQMISYYKIIGLHELGGGDLVFADNGRLYISCTAGLYKCEFGSGNNINATRISADNLPNYPNSLTFDQNQELWWASNIVDHGELYIMDTTTGGWEGRYSLSDNYIHDLTTLPLDQTQIEEQDSDGDGIIDFYDEYPDDGDRAYDTYTPSIYGWGTYAFEDLWPDQGDYDFNDLVLNYRFTNVLNADDEVVETIMNFKIKNVGGSHQNGFGIEMDFPASYVQDVSGYGLTEGIVSLNSQGLEMGQDNPVVIIFDNAWTQTKASTDELEVLITYTTPVSESEIMNYNPFIFIGGDRGREVHLSDYPPTTLADASLFGTADDTSDPATGRYYKNNTNLPWAIDIIHDFVYPKEKSAINLGYNRFADWAESGGTLYPDWYKDQNDYRNNTYLVLD